MCIILRCLSVFSFVIFWSFSFVLVHGLEFLGVSLIIVKLRFMLKASALLHLLLDYAA